MNNHSIWLIAACLALSTGDVRSRDAVKLPPAPEVFTKLQQAVATAGKNAEPSLALVKIESDNAAPPMVIKGMTLKSVPAHSAPTTKPCASSRKLLPAR